MVSGDPYGGWEHYPDRLDMRVWSHDMRRARPVGVKMSGSIRSQFTGAGSGSLVVARDHPLADRLMQADYDVVPVTATLNGVQWSGFVDEYVCEGAPGEEILTCTLLDWYTMMHQILGRPSPFAPLEAQMPPQDTKAAPLVTTVLHFILRNAIRLGLPLYVRAPDGVDRSPWVTRWSRMTPLDEVIEPALEEHGYQLRVSMIGAGADLPFPVMSARGWMAATDPVLNAIDNFFQFFIKTPPGVTDPGEITRIGTAGLLVECVPKRERQFVRWSTEGGGIKHLKTTGKRPTASTVVVGGKSPAWVTDMIDLGIDVAIGGLLSAIGTAVGTALGPIGGIIGGAIGDLAGNFFDNVFLAYSEYTDVDLRAQLGPFGPPEAFVSSGAGIFSLDAIDAGISGLQEHKGGRSIEITLEDGVPHRWGLDEKLDDGRIRRGYQVGDINVFSDRGTEIEDYISSVEATDDQNGLTVTATVGDSRIVDDPQVKQIRDIKKMITNLRASALASN